MAGPDRYQRYAEQRGATLSILSKQDLSDGAGEGESSAFLIETRKQMSADEVAERLRPHMPEAVRHSLSVISLDASDEPAADDETAGRFFEAEIALNQFPDDTEHALAAIEFAAWLEADQASWLASVEADIAWKGESDVDAKRTGILSGAGGLCSEGGPPGGHDWHWGLERVRAGAAMQYSLDQQRPAGGAGIPIGHIDTGYGGHVEMEAGSCQPDKGYDLILNAPGGFDPMGGDPSRGHGDSTASVMLSRHLNQVRGIAPGAYTVPFRAIRFVAVFTKMGRVARAIDMATKADVAVISMSLGGLALFSGLRAKLKKAVDKGIIIVAAAGNCVGFTVAPASFDECIAVSGIGPDADRPWPHASRARPGVIDVAAPAQWVAAASHAGGGASGISARGEGTSYATAMVAGAAAQWLAHHGRQACHQAAQNAGLSVQDYFRILLRASADDSGTNFDVRYGHGVLDVEALLHRGLPAPDQLPDAHAKAVLAMKSAPATGADALSTRERFMLAMGVRRYGLD